MPLTLDLLPHHYCVCRLPPDAPIDPSWFPLSGLASITRTDQELSVVLSEEHVPADAKIERGFRALCVRGPLAFELTGILAGLATALANVRVSIFAISTFDTDILLVREGDLDRAVEALRAAGHEVVGRD